MYPELIQTKFFILNTLWIFFAISIIIATYTLIKLSSKEGLKIQFLSEHSLKIILWSILGARIFAILNNLDTYFYKFSFGALIKIFYIWDKGLSPEGALIVAIIYFYLLCKKYDQNFFKWLDTIIPSIILGLAITYLGKFFDGTNYGNPTSLPWGVNFESPQIKYTVPIHPTQIYAFLYSLTIFAALYLLNKNTKIAHLEKKGFIGILGIGLFAFFNFLEQFFRGDDTYTIFEIRIIQILALLVAIFSGIFLIFRYNKSTKIKKLFKSKK